MANGKRDGFCYSDGIPIKLNERLKLPPRISLPDNFNPTISVELLDEYDFMLEHRVLEFSEARRQAKEARDKEKANQVSTAIEQFTQIPNPEVSKTGDLNKTNEFVTKPENHFSWPKSTELLNPQLLNDPLEVNINQKQLPLSKTIANGSINLSDFEDQGTSPFDYVELQTLNDLEELNTVFQGLAVPGTVYDSETNVRTRNDYLNTNKRVSDCAGPILNQSNACPIYNGYSMTTRSVENQPDSISDQTLPKYVFNEITPRLRSSKSASDVRTEVNLDAVYMKRSQTPPPVSRNKFYSHTQNLVATNTMFTLQTQPPAATNMMIYPQTQPKIPEKKRHSLPNPPQPEPDRNDILPDPYDHLNSDQQNFVQSFMDMGFPRDRSARAVKHLGIDDKKVLDHLCQVENLIEKGYDHVDAEMALHLHDYNVVQAKEFLELLTQFQDLGFDKVIIRKALISHKNDKDKVLDYLLS